MYVYIGALGIGHLLLSGGGVYLGGSPLKNVCDRESHHVFEGCIGGGGSSIIISCI